MHWAFKKMEGPNGQMCGEATSRGKDRVEGVVTSLTPSREASLHKEQLPTHPEFFLPDQSCCLSLPKVSTPFVGLLCPRVPNASRKGNFTSFQERPHKPNVRTFWLISLLSNEKRMVWIYFLFNMGKNSKAPSLHCDGKARHRINAQIRCKGSESTSSKSQLCYVPKTKLFLLIFLVQK